MWSVDPGVFNWNNEVIWLADIWSPPGVHVHEHGHGIMQD